MSKEEHQHCICGASSFEPVFHYDAPPKVEIAFQFSAGELYKRNILRCKLCGHLISVHQMRIDSLYTGDYVSSNYKDEAGIKRTFDKINSLPAEQSDNVGRARRIVEFAGEHFAGEHCGGGTGERNLLDVGSGLGVFVYRMKQAGWQCTALDPDPRSVTHAEANIGVKGICGDFMEVDAPKDFDLVTFNKVLEHVPDPVAMLAKARDNVSADGFVYVELPDGEVASRVGKEREEFTIDHLHVFSMASIAILAERAGFTVKEIERLQEPSSKYTLRAFLVR